MLIKHFFDNVKLLASPSWFPKTVISFLNNYWDSLAYLEGIVYNLALLWRMNCKTYPEDMVKTQRYIGCHRKSP